MTRGSSVRSGLAACLAASVAAGAAFADDAAGQCKVADRSEIIAILICDAGLSEAALSAAGKTACEGHRPCGVWFYDDAAAMPKKAPQNHDGLTQDQVTRALAVWDNDREVLVSISRVED